MIDGPARKVWIFGATSAIAQAYARRRAAQGAAMVLIGRNESHLRANAPDLQARGAADATVEVVDLALAGDYDGIVSRLISTHGAPDEVLIAYGILGDQARAVRDLDHARDIIVTNFTSVCLWTLAIISHHDGTRDLTLAVIGSVAGDRGRASNFVYGAAKGGLDRFLEGLQHANANGPVHVVRIKPGLVDTPMTANIAKGGPLWASADRVAADIERAIDRKRALTYTPAFWRLIMLVIRHLPRFVFNQLKI